MLLAGLVDQPGTFRDSNVGIFRGDTVVHMALRDRQEDDYQALAKAHNYGDSASFLEFILSALLEALGEVGESDQESDQVGDQVMCMLQVLAGKEAGASELMREMSLSHRPTFRKNFLDPALSKGVIERNQPDTPRSPTQLYRLTEKGRRVLDRQF